MVRLTNIVCRIAVNIFVAVVHVVTTLRLDRLE